MVSPSEMMKSTDKVFFREGKKASSSQDIQYEVNQGIFIFGL